jgi:uncharacterized membrane protein YfcA
MELTGHGAVRMLTYVVICTVALLVSMLTLVSGFGLGTLLLPAFAAFFPIGVAIAATAIVHLANNIMKLALVGKYAHTGVVFRFAAGALPAAVFGAWLLTTVGTLDPIITYNIGSLRCDATALGIVVGGALVAFAILEFIPGFDTWAFPPKFLALGGLISGFFGGLTGMQGALRSAFLLRCGLTKDQYVGTGAVIATLIDLTRLSVYLATFFWARVTLEVPGGASAGMPASLWKLVGAACLAAFVGSYIGSLLVKKITIKWLKVIVAASLGVCGVFMIAGIILA